MRSTLDIRSHLRTQTQDPNSIQYWVPYRLEIEPKLQFLADLWAGQHAWVGDILSRVPLTSIRDMGLVTSYESEVRDLNKCLAYLPKGSGEESADYLHRLKFARFERLFRDAIERDIAPLLSQYQLIDLHEDISPYLDDIDWQGTSLKLFILDAICKRLRDGCVFLMVNFPPTQSDAREMLPWWMQFDEPRPYAQIYPRSRLVYWAPQGKKPQVMRFLNYRDVPDGKFGTKSETIYETYEMRDDGFCWYSVTAVTPDDKGVLNEVLLTEFATTFEEIPVVIYGEIQAEIPGDEMPFYDVALLNLEHYRCTTDNSYYLHLCNCPTLQLNDINPIPRSPDEKEAKIYIGVNAVFQNKEAQWIELSGASIQNNERAIAKLEEKIASRTLAFINGNTSAPMTATEVSYDAAQAMASIEGHAIELESAMQQFFDLWVRILDPLNEEPAGNVRLDRNVLRIGKLGTIQEIMDMIATGRISDYLGLLLLRDRGFFWDGFTDADVKAELLRLGYSAEQIQAFEEIATRLNRGEDLVVVANDLGATIRVNVAAPTQQNTVPPEEDDTADDENDDENEDELIAV